MSEFSAVEKVALLLRGQEMAEHALSLSHCSTLATVKFTMGLIVDDLHRLTESLESGTLGKDLQ